MTQEQEPRVIFLKGKKTVLRPLNKETDMESIMCWINDQETIQYLNRFLPVSIQQEEEWFDSLAKRKDDIVLAIETLDGLFIGSVGLHGIDWKNRTATHGALIGNKDYWGKGYGRDVYMTLFNYAFNSLNLRKICAQILSFNERSVKCALACGYQIEGKQRKQNYVKGEYWDLIIIGVFKEEWLLKWKEYNKEA